MRTRCVLSQILLVHLHEADGFRRADRFANRNRHTEQSFVVFQVELRSGVALGFHRVRVRFEEQRIGTGGHARKCQVRNETRFSARRICRRNAVKTNDVSRIETRRRTELLHQRDRTHVGDETVVTE